MTLAAINRKYLFVALLAVALLALASFIPGREISLSPSNSNLHGPLTGDTINYVEAIPSTTEGSNSTKAETPNTATSLGAPSADTSLSNAGNASASSDALLSISSGLQVYFDSACNNPVESIEWGSISPGGTDTVTVFIKNTESSNSLSLSLGTSDWNPTSAGQYLTLSWNQQGKVLAAGQTIEASITLAVSPSIVGVTTFSMQITVSGTSS